MQSDSNLSSCQASESSGCSQAPHLSASLQQRCLHDPCVHVAPVLPLLCQCFSHSPRLHSKEPIPSESRAPAHNKCGLVSPWPSGQNLGGKVGKIRRFCNFRILGACFNLRI